MQTNVCILGGPRILELFLLPFGYLYAVNRSVDAAGQWGCATPFGAHQIAMQGYFEDLQGWRDMRLMRLSRLRRRC